MKYEYFNKLPFYYIVTCKVGSTHNVSITLLLPVTSLFGTLFRNVHRALFIEY